MVRAARVLAVAVVALLALTGVAAAAIIGTAGSDTLTGTPGDDAIYGLAGNDNLNGLQGNDDLYGGPGADDIRGGPGDDAVSYGGVSAPVTVTLDDRANDGAAGAGDNVHGDVEDIYGGTGDDSLTGDAADNTIDGGAGNDTIVGGTGFDFLYGGAGNDVLDARDGEQDVVDCGPGDDRAIVDRVDLVTGCERRGTALPSARATATIHHFWLAGATFTRVAQLDVVDVHPVPATITVRCHGDGCPFARRSARVTTAAGRSFTSSFRGARLRVGTRVEVRVTAANRLGKYVRFTMRRRRLPAIREACLAPGSSAPIRCP
jgi:Ca2+-binding RTX toxin-like protein